MGIAEAMQTEIEYLAIKNKKEAAKFNLRERLEFAGYKDISVFHKEKAEYLFSQNKPLFIETTFEEIDVGGTIKNGESVLFCVRPKKGWVFVGSEKKASIEFIAENEISKKDFKHSGGVTYSAEYDLDIIAPVKFHNGLEFMTMKVCEAMNRAGINATYDAGRLFINGELIGCGTEEKIYDYSVYYFAISFKVYPEILNGLCPDASLICSPIVKGINDFYPSVTRDALFEELRSWLQ